MLSDLEKKVIASIQGDIPVSQSPYLEMATSIGITEEKFLSILTKLNEKKIIRRYGATLRHQKSGFIANAMVAWKVKADKIEQVGSIMALFKEVSHCYCRNITDSWSYNMYTMVHAVSEKICIEIAHKISEKTKVKEYLLLFSRKEFKKTSMKYFQKELNL